MRFNFVKLRSSRLCGLSGEVTISTNFGDNFQKQVTISKKSRLKSENIYLCGMKRVCFSVFLLLLLLSCQQPLEEVRHGGITYVPMKAKRLPDMNEARMSHGLVWASDHLLAIGGHTTGFVPSTTAEYYEGGRWHTLSTLYPHDTPFALVLKNDL